MTRRFLDAKAELAEVLRAVADNPQRTDAEGLHLARNARRPEPFFSDPLTLPGVNFGDLRRRIASQTEGWLLALRIGVGPDRQRHGHGRDGRLRFLEPGHAVDRANGFSGELGSHHVGMLGTEVAACGQVVDLRDVATLTEQEADRSRFAVM